MAIRKSLARLALAVLTAVPAAAVGAQYSCVGPVAEVLVSPTGVVSAGSLGGITWGYWCSISSATNGVSPEACRGVLAVLLAAQTSGRDVQVWFDDGLSCTTRTPWTWQTGWYWGPALRN